MWPSFRLSHLIHRSCPRYFHPQGPKIAKTCSGKNRGILILFKCTEVVHTCSVINLPFANFTCPVVLKNLCQCAIAWTKLATLFRRKVVHRFAKKTAACILLAKILSFNSQKDVLPISWSISVVERMRKNVFLLFPSLPVSSSLSSAFSATSPRNCSKTYKVSLLINGRSWIMCCKCPICSWMFFISETIRNSNCHNRVISSWNEIKHQSLLWVAKRAAWTSFGMTGSGKSRKNSFNNVATSWTPVSIESVIWPPRSNSSLNYKKDEYNHV